MNALLFLALGIWLVALLFLARQLYLAPVGYQDAAGFHALPDTGWHHVRFHHARRDHRSLRHDFAMAMWRVRERDAGSFPPRAC